MTELPTIPNTRVRRLPERGSYDRELAYPLLDAAQIAHVGFVVDAQPYVIPMLFVRIDDCIFLHGSVGSRMLQHLATGAPCCVTVTHLDGLVLARSHFNHSANYRSVVVFGHSTLVSDLEQKERILLKLVDALVPGRSLDGRAANRKELAATALLEVQIEHLSVKTRSGGPKDLDDDMNLPVWAGVVPLQSAAGAPIAACDLNPDIRLPSYLQSGVYAA